MPENPEVSVVIVTWNSGGEIARCVNSVIKNSGNINTEIIVVDNNSTDNTKEKLEELNNSNGNKITLIYNTDNRGFTKACNQGLKMSGGECIFLLNPDTELTEGSLDILTSKLNSEKSYGAVSPKLLNEDGTIQKSCRTFPEYADMFFEMILLSSLFPKSKVFSRWKMNYFDHDSEREVDQPMAAALLIKKSAAEEIGFFDERYKMFFNDVDICKKISDNGYKIIFCPGAEVIHTKGVSIYKDRENMIRIWNKDCAEYFSKHHKNIILQSLLSAGLKLTGIIRILIYKLKK
ncbi:MAG: glycosyltransferase family 2 protein [Ignavibacteria bacterium]|nr:glycosyltransferase family 2 protein [Ignavibacteria bacterium]